VKKMIKVSVEGVGSGGTAYFDIPDDWDDLTPAEQEDMAAETAVDYRENVASCGGQVVEVEDDFEG